MSTSDHTANSLQRANTRQVGGTHYQTEYQHWDLAWNLRLQHLPAAITKYITRHRNKNKVQDLEKALHYAEKYCELLRAAAYVEVPLPRALYAEVGEYTAKMADYVNNEVMEYCTANKLADRERTIVMLLCLPHSVGTLVRVRNLIVDLTNEVYPERRVGAPAAHGAHYEADEESGGLEGYVCQDQAPAYTPAPYSGRTTES